MAQMTLEQFEQEIQQAINKLRTEHFNEETKEWRGDENTGRALRERVRELKFSVQEKKDLERYQELKELDRRNQGKITAEQLGEMRILAALVDRRKRTDLWHTINKVAKDGTLFTFDKQDTETVTVCGCTDDDLMRQFDNNRGLLQFVSNSETLEVMTGFSLPDEEGTAWICSKLKQQHQLMFEGVHKTGASCNHPKEIQVAVRQDTHVIGDVNCKACVFDGVAQSMAKLEDDPLGEFGNGLSKLIAACPRYFSLLRSYSFEAYINLYLKRKSAATDEHNCFAGLLHSSLRIEEREIDGRALPVAVLRRKCDTCGWYEESFSFYEPEIEAASHQPSGTK